MCVRAWSRVCGECGREVSDLRFLMSLQVRPSGRDHGLGLPEQGALCDRGRSGQDGQGVEDR